MKLRDNKKYFHVDFRSEKCIRKKIVGPWYVSDYAARLCISCTINLDTMQTGEKQSWSNQSR